MSSVTNATPAFGTTVIQVESPENVAFSVSNIKSSDTSSFWSLRSVQRTACVLSAGSFAAYLYFMMKAASNSMDGNNSSMPLTTTTVPAPLPDSALEGLAFMVAGFFFASLTCYVQIKK